MTQLALSTLLGAAVMLLALAAHRRLTRVSHCGWCATASGWPTSSHDAAQCRGYVQDRRRERERDIAHGRPVEQPDPWPWSQPGENAPQPEPAGPHARAAVRLTEAITLLATEYPTDAYDTITLPLQIGAASGAAGIPAPVPLQPGQLEWLADLVERELNTVRHAHSDGDGHCGHCGGARRDLADEARPA
ncbi:hypothetical protein [Streptomyces roseolus]|uniref:hypothetical protein n=1 Tax=Streptomyces roseolus TaxID=67358 RepID=UPI003799FD2B